MVFPLLAVYDVRLRLLYAVDPGREISAGYVLPRVVSRQSV